MVASADRAAGSAKRRFKPLVVVPWRGHTDSLEAFGILAPDAATGICLPIVSPAMPTPELAKRIREPMTAVVLIPASGRQARLDRMLEHWQLQTRTPDEVVVSIPDVGADDAVAERRRSRHCKLTHVRGKSGRRPNRTVHSTTLVPVCLMVEGTIPPPFGISLMARNLTANCFKSLWPEPLRRSARAVARQCPGGRLLLRGRVEPEHVLKL